MSKTTKPKRAKPDEQPQPQPASEASILDPSQARRELAQARRELEKWQARFYFLATLDPIQFKHFHRRVINSGLSWEEMVDKECGSFLDKGI